MEYTAVSANLGCGGPHALARREWAVGWFEECLAREDDILLLQEVPKGLELDVLKAGYDVFTAASTDGRHCMSAVALRRALGLRGQHFPLASAGYHSSYVAAAQVDLPGVGPTVVLSIHASPTELSDADKEKWPFEAPPPPRPTGEGLLWDSDYVLSTVIDLANQGHPVLAGGDWNEVRAWDENHAGTWGAEFFERIADAGLVDCTFSRWGQEQATRGGYQLDHVIASPGIDALVGAVELGGPNPPDGSDHLAIRFTIGLAGR